jgi:hypothetical protein
MYLKVTTDEKTFISLKDESLRLVKVPLGDVFTTLYKTLEEARSQSPEAVEEWASQYFYAMQVSGESLMNKSNFSQEQNTNSGHNQEIIKTNVN